MFAQSLSCLAEGMLMLLGTLRERWATFDEAQRLNLLGLVDDHAANLSVLLRDAVGGSRGLPPIEGKEAWKWSSATIELP